MVKLSGSFLKIQKEENKIKKLDEVFDYVHYDICDGKFTERATLDINEMILKLKDIKKPLDVHLMVLDLKKYIDIVSILKPKFITFHIESVDNPLDIIDYIKSKNIKVGLALNPETDFNSILPYLDKIDLVLVMSVKAGAGGQKFINITDKLNKVINYRNENNLSYLIEVDGGINDNTISYVKNADIIVVGSFVTNSDNYQSQILKLKKALRNGFTLAELLGVIVVLSILGLVAFISIDNSIKKSRYNSCLVQEENLIEGAKMVLTEYPELIPDSGNTTINIPVSVLEKGGTVNSINIDSGYIDDDLVNPMTDQPYSGGVSVKVTINGKKQSFDVIYSNNDESCHR